MREIEKKVGEVGEWLGAGCLNFFGRQFAGKDTHAERIGRQLGATILGGGDILRNSVIPEHIREIMNSGELIPSDEYRRMVLPFLSHKDFANKPLLLSAVGRMFGEELGVIDATQAAGHPIMAVPYLEITEEESFRRLASSPSRGRADDTPAGLRERLDQFNEHTMPVLNAYEDRGLLIRVNAMPDKETVFTNLVNQLHDVALQS